MHAKEERVRSARVAQRASLQTVRFGDRVSDLLSLQGWEEGGKEGSGATLRSSAIMGRVGGWERWTLFQMISGAADASNKVMYCIIKASEMKRTT